MEREDGLLMFVSQRIEFYLRSRAKQRVRRDCLERSDKPCAVVKLKGAEVVCKIRLHLPRTIVPAIDDQYGTFPEPFGGIEQLSRG